MSLHEWNLFPSGSLFVCSKLLLENNLIIRGEPERFILYLKFFKKCENLKSLMSKQTLNEQPIRSELFSAYQMGLHGEHLAKSHNVIEDVTVDQLLYRLGDNEKIIIETCDLLAKAIKNKRQITPASEWLLDNHPLIAQHIRLARKHLPKGYSRGLPRLRNGNVIGNPRVYELALEIISHSDARLESESLSLFISSYQKTSPLKLGELWAIPIMLRLALIENLRRVAARIYISRTNRNLADDWSDRMIDVVENDSTNLILVIADMARSKPSLDASFIAEMARRLQGQGPALAMPLTWMEQRLEETGVTIEQLVHAEVQQQAIDQVSVSNSVGSLRFLDDMNWQKFVESSSIVEDILKQDPTQVYSLMDFTTRDHYRHRVEGIAKESGISEELVARKLLSLAQDYPDDHRRGHVGYYLIDEGLPQLESEIAYKPKFWNGCYRFFAGHPLSVYLGFIFLIVVDLTHALINHASRDGMDHWLITLTGIFGVFAASHLAISMVNLLATIIAKPEPLARLDFSEGIPEHAKTMVVVPTLLSNLEGVEDLCEALEVRYLANPGRHLYYGLLTDFTDAKEEVLLTDEELLTKTESRIHSLNQKYAQAGVGPFYLFHRPRIWNESEGVWMGWERKRGKLEALNAFLVDGDQTGFSRIVGHTDALTQIKYVVTLDTDTQLPRDTVWQLAAAMAHPLNQPVYDEKLQRVVAGYGILQPRVAASLPGNNASIYAQLSGGEPGIDPYTRAVSDVYQDAFGEGSFIGKGIYDVEMFARVLKGRFPTNKILSHDLLEGSFIRSGLLSDVQLYEAYPSKYSDDVSRRHRWIRGDWQIAGWVFGKVKVADGQYYKNPLSILSRWKIFDNLRRSIVPLAFVVLLVNAWLFSTNPTSWMLQIAALLLLPSIYATIFDLSQKSKEITIGQHLTASAFAMGRHLGNTGFTFLCLPYDAFYSIDAIIRTAWRMLVSKKKLLEWTASGEAGRRNGADLASVISRMWFAPVFAVAIGYILISRDMPSLYHALPVLVLWTLSPMIVWKLSLPIKKKEAELSKEQTIYLRKIARKTWAFFETYVGPNDNWLPPDNIQERPVAAVAHRTSPTNMGMALLANLSAYDFGYITLGTLIERTQNTLLSMAELERFRGHFYNWYDTQTLVPLQPLYVSTVDSGNLAGHLLVLRAGLIGLLDKPIVNSRLFEGLLDTYHILRDSVGEANRKLMAIEALLIEACENKPQSLSMIISRLKIISNEVDDCLSELKSSPFSEAVWWATALSVQLRKAYDEVILFSDLNQVDVIHTLRGLARQNNLPLIIDFVTKIEELASIAGDMSIMDYDFLYEKNKRLLSIGYHVNERRLDTGYYDLLASEARLGCFVAIAQGLLPQESWFALGRQLRMSGHKALLVSWSGSMFEYLMPLLVMPTYDKTLLDQTYKTAVLRQMNYGEQRDVPWGVSESGYYAFDASLNYQYRAFGVPGTGMKRDLADDLVIAPYASAMGLMVMPKESCENLQRLSREGFEGRYGLYEAIDFTPARLPRGKDHALVQSFMAHHQGMSFLSLAYCLLDQPMQKRFASEPMFQSTMLLLHEKIPRSVAIYSTEPKFDDIRLITEHAYGASVRVFNTAMMSAPEVNLLSNGRYHVMTSSSGGSYSRWGDLAVTRWREDSTRDHWGAFCYMKDLSNGSFWSTSYQPTLSVPELYEAIFSEGRTEFRRRDRLIDTHTEIVVSPEDDIEMRRTRMTNNSNIKRTIEITSYAEIVLAPPMADAAHPAFSNLFVQTEILHKRHAIMATRRPRSYGEGAPWMFHLMVVHGADVEQVSYETDRMKFIGRGQTTAAPQAVVESGLLSDTAGPVLDPIVAIKYRITLEPEQSAIIDIVTGAADNREACDAMIDKYQDRHLADRVLELAWTHSQVILRQLNASEADAQLYARLASAIIYPNASLRADASVILKNRRGQSGLWSYAISGDLPIVLLQIKDIANIELVRQMVQAHAYWRIKGLAVDLVIWNEDNAGYRQTLQDQIYGMIAAGVDANVIDRPGGIFVRPGDQISYEDRILLESVACVIISDERGGLEEQINRPPIKTVRMPRLTLPAVPVIADKNLEVALSEDLLLYNGIGGFSKDGREYVIVTKAGQKTPAPWSNVIANPQFGTVISERGQAYTWSENAHEYRLSPWHNDPVGDQSGEAIYIRDEVTGKFWSPTPNPCESRTPYITRHGFGYSVFEHVENGIQSELTVYVDTVESVKFSVLKITNLSGRARHITATGYVELVLADLRSKSKLHVITEIESQTGALIARNAYNTEFTDRIVFFDVDDLKKTITGDRREFIGRNGSLQHPSSMDRLSLSGKVGAALDPCVAIQVPIDLISGQTRQITFRLGMGGKNTEEVANTIRRVRGPEFARASLAAVHSQWRDILGAVQIDTPDQSLNILTNGWLMYQTIACRMWARSGYYQSGGAYGYRDQLQDAMAIVHTRPDLLRSQILLHAGHQFVEGDVQHWWHPPSDRGVRTKCSDDYLWLPLATSRYVVATGGTGVLDEVVHFIEGRKLNPDEDSYYDLPIRSGESASLYQHCVRAIEHGLRFGEHGLPLIGSCDWNDGMDKVGQHGRGESVWLAFFLYDILLKFAPIARLQNDVAFATRCELEAKRLQGNIEKHAWDGAWYRRAYFDDGTSLGTAEAEECRIDSLSQSWAILSGAGDLSRSKTAMEAVDHYLVRREYGLVQLLDPPFDKSTLNPGYIRGYVPGVRENGGQYTHAAIWTAMAFAKLGDNDKAFEILQMINPLNHSRNKEEAMLYKVEPYVVTADVYAVTPHIGRGGWSWYTGSSGWLYRLILESIIGLNLENDKLIFKPCLPKEWSGCTVSYKYKSTQYTIRFKRAVGKDQNVTEIHLVDDGRCHEETVFF